MTRKTQKPKKNKGLKKIIYLLFSRRDVFRTKQGLNKKVKETKKLYLPVVMISYSMRIPAGAQAQSALRGNRHA